MANELESTTLYAETCRLAYTVSGMAIRPRLPFVAKDKGMLAQLSTDLAECALKLREADPRKLRSALVKDCLTRVRTSQAVFDFINNTTGTRPDSSEATDSVKSVLDSYATAF